MSMVEMDLFAFDFSQDQEEMYSEDNVWNQFKELQLMSQENRNGYYIGLEKLPNKMIMFIDKFVENGWIERRANGISILDDYLIHETVDEVVNRFKRSMYNTAKKENVCWYKDVISVINASSGPIRWLDEWKEQFSIEKQKIIREYALKFGLEHFKTVPTSRGMKSSHFGKWSKEHVLPIITNTVLNMDTFDEVDKFFKSNLFFLGRRDWDQAGYCSNYQIPPYPEFVQISPSMFDIACLVQAETEQDIELVLDYAGICWNSTMMNHNIIYPKGWSFETYLNSLTDEDKELLHADRKRLISLHNRDVMKDSIVFKNI